MRYPNYGSIRRAITSIALFLRFEYLVFALMLPILGAASVQPSLTRPQVIWLLISAFCFHVFISLQNDICDLQLDRTDPRRRNYPLVKGTVRVRSAAALMVLQIPLIAALISWRGSTGQLAASSILVLGLMSIYNVWGKRTRFPILLDLVQGLGFAGLVLYGAAGSGSFTLLSWMAFWAVVMWMMQTNHLGGIRDLQSDYGFHLFTSPISLGSKYTAKGYFISGTCLAYSALLLLMQFALPLVYLWKERSVIDPSALISIAIIEAVVLAAAGHTLARFFRIASEQFRIEMDLAYVVMFLSGLPMLAALALNKNRWVLICAAVILVAALRTYARVSLKLNRQRGVGKQEYI